MTTAIEAVALAIHGHSDLRRIAWDILLPSDRNLFFDQARAAMEALAANVSDEMVRAYQLHLQSILGSTYIPTKQGTEDVRTAIAAAIREGVRG